MKKTTLALLAIAGLASVANAQVYPFAGTPLLIPDNNPTGVSITTGTIAGATAIAQVTASIQFSPRHTWIGDLVVNLVYVAPDSSETTVVLFNQVGNGDSSDLFGTYNFADSGGSLWTAAAAIGGAATVPPGIYAPSGAGNASSSFGTFTGLLAGGTFRLAASDLSVGDVGTIANASVTVTLAGVPNAPTTNGGSTTVVRGLGTLPPYTAVLTTTVAAGSSPASTGLTSRIDLSPIGGSATALMFDNGTNGDLAAGDGIYSLSVNVDAAADGVYAFNTTVSDAQARTATSIISLNLSTTTVTALGTLSLPGSPTLSGSGTWETGGVTWFSVNNQVDGTDPNAFVDMWTVTPGIDTEIAVYDSLGNLVNADDDGGVGLLSQLSFGLTEAAPGRLHNGMTASEGQGGRGEDGSLPVGTYFIAMGRFNVIFGATNFGIGTTIAGTGGSNDLTILAGTVFVSQPTNPTQFNALAPATWTRSTGGPAGPTVSGISLLTTAVTPGAFPTSLSYTATADLSEIGGSATAALFDDGTNGDINPGDNVFSLAIDTVAFAAGVYSISTSVTDNDLRVAAIDSVTLIINEATVIVEDLGTLVFNGTPINRSFEVVGNSVNWIKFTVNAPGVDSTRYLDIDSNGSARDTHLGLFDNAGTFLFISDDDDGDGVDSALTFGSTDPTGRDTNVGGLANNGRDGELAAGTYYVALNFWPATYGTPFIATTTSGGAGGLYVVNVYPGTPGVVAPTCLADIVGGDGNPPADGSVDGNDFQSFLNAFGAGAPVADIVGGDGNPPADGSVDGNDFQAFLNAFGAGC